MRSYQTIEIAKDARGVASLTMARPAKHNALDETMIAELHRAAKDLGADDSVRVVVLSGQGKSFCAGGDLGWMRQQMDGTRDKRIAQATALAQMLQALDTMPKPLIARVQRPAYGGGIGLMSVCDVAVVDSGATFMFSETRLGLIPATIAPFVMRVIGEAAARAYFLNARPFDAATAKDLGLATSVVATDDLEAAIATEVGYFLDCAPGAVAQAKAMCQRLDQHPGDDQLAWTVAQLADRWDTTEAKQGIEAFFAKDKPPWRHGD